MYEFLVLVDEKLQGKILRNFKHGIWRPDVDKLAERKGSPEGSEEIKKYVQKLMAAVDTGFRNLCNKPRVHIRIHSLDLTTASQYIKYENGLLHAYQTLQAMEFFQRNGPDAVLLLTGDALCGNYGNIIKCTDDQKNSFGGSLFGYTWPFGVCLTTPGSYRAVSIVHDNGRFSGVFPATHEFGHLILGAKHDGDQKNKRECSATHGYIMMDGVSALEFSKRNIHRWSQCTEATYLERLTNDTTGRTNCMRNRPTHGIPLATGAQMRPPQIPPLIDQCKPYVDTQLSLVKIFSLIIPFVSFFFFKLALNIRSSG